MDPVVHFEIPVDDLERAKAFYGELFGWQVSDVPGMDYTMAVTTPVNEQHMPTQTGAINGGMFKRNPLVKAPVFAIAVSSVDEYVPRVEAAGGTVAMAKTEIPGMGWYAYVTDPEGNIVGLWQSLA